VDVEFYTAALEIRGASAGDSVLGNLDDAVRTGATPFSDRRL